jgi:hypothetical protein
MSRKASAYESSNCFHFRAGGNPDLPTLDFRRNGNDNQFPLWILRQRRYARSTG